MSEREKQPETRNKDILDIPYDILTLNYLDPSQFKTALFFCLNLFLLLLFEFDMIPFSKHRMQQKFPSFCIEYSFSVSLSI